MKGLECTRKTHLRRLFGILSILLIRWKKDA